MKEVTNFDKFINKLFAWEEENPTLFNIIGHIILITCVVGNIAAFIYALLH